MASFLGMSGEIKRTEKQKEERLGASLNLKVGRDERRGDPSTQIMTALRGKCRSQF